MRILLRLLLGISALAGLTIVALAVFLATFDPNAYKDTLVARVQAATGRTLTLDGPLEVGVWPSLRLRAGPMSLGNAAGFGPAPMLALEELQVAAATWPLLLGRLEMQTLRLRGARIELARDAAGVRNWDDLVRTGTADATRGGQAGGRGGFGAIVLGGIDVQDMQIHWRDARAGREVTVSDLDARSGALAFGTPVPIDLTARLASPDLGLEGALTLHSVSTYTPATGRTRVEPLEFSADLQGKALPEGRATLGLRAVIDADADSVTFSALEASGLGHTAGGTLTLSGLRAPRPAARGTITVEGRDLAVLFRAFGLPGAAPLARQKARGFDLASEFDIDLDSGRLAVPALKARVLGATLEGTLSGARVGSATPMLSGKLAAKGADLPALVMIGHALGGADEAASKRLARALGAPPERAFAVDGEFMLDLATGKLDLPRFDARVLGNTLTARLSAPEDAGEPGNFTGELRAEGPDLGVLALTAAGLGGAGDTELAALQAVLAKHPARRFTLHAPLAANLTRRQLSLSALAATIYGNDVRGNLRLDATATAPRIEGDLTAEGPDLPSLLALSGALQGGGLAGLAAKLATAANKAFTFSTRFSFDGPQRRFGVPALSFGAFGLGLDGSLAASGVGGNAARMDGTLSLKGSEPGPLLTALGHPELAKSVRSLDLATKLSGNGTVLSLRPFEATLGLVRPGGNAPLNLKLTLDAAETDLAAHTASIRKLALTGLGLFVRGDLEVAKLDAKPTLNGTLSVPEFNLRDVLSVLNMPATHLTDPASLTRIAFDTRIVGTDGALVLKPLTLKLDDATITGEFTLRSPTGPDLAFDLHTDALDVDRYRAGADGERAAAVTPEAAAAGAAQLPLATLRALRLDGRFAADRLTVSGLALTRVGIALQGRDGRLAIDPAEADLYGGHYRGKVTLDATGTQPVLALDTTLAKVALEPLMTDVNGSSDLTGLLNLEARLSTVGSDTARLARGLNGAGSFAVTDGELRGIDIPATLRTAEVVLESKQLQLPPSGGSTRFQSLTGSLDVRDGAVFNRDLLLDGLGFKVSGEGMLANLADFTTKYDASIRVDEGSLEQGAKRYSLGDYDIPIRCRGKLSGASCLPDFGELGKRAAVKAVKDKVEEKLDKSLEGAGEALRKLLKF